ncbi:conjugal transfer protein [Streptomyces sp. NPDC003327]
MLGLPDAADWDERKKRREKKTPQALPHQHVNPWETAAQQLREQRTAPASLASAPRTAAAQEPAAPWVTVEERSGSAFARRFGRGVLWTLVAAFALLGAKSVLIPKKTPAPVQSTAPVQAGPTYPDNEAQAVASRFARSYLSWDEKDPEARAAALAAVLPDSADTKMGWDGKGRQDVLAVEPGAVTATAQKQARVRVDVLVRPAAATPPKPGAAPAPTLPAHWIGLDVPVVQAGGRIIVTGPPGMVGIPAAGPTAPTLAGPEADSAFSEQTSETVTKFFTAYAAGDTEAVTAPGASVPPLPSGVSLVGVTSWTADKGSGTDRTGTARVTWQIAGAQLDQTYRVELTRVASQDAQRWQVAAVHGGTA